MAWASSPRPIDILVRISLYVRTGARPTAPKNPVYFKCGVAVHAGPDSFTGGGHVVDLPSAHVDAGVDTTEERHERGPRRLEIGGITQPERG